MGEQVAGRGAVGGGPPLADRAMLEIGDLTHEVSVHITEDEERDALWA